MAFHTEEFWRIKTKRLLTILMSVVLVYSGVLYAQGVGISPPPPDRDNDGIPDASDRCPDDPRNECDDDIDWTVPECTDEVKRLCYTLGFIGAGGIAYQAGKAFIKGVAASINPFFLFVSSVATLCGLYCMSAELGG